MNDRERLAGEIARLRRQEWWLLLALPFALIGLHTCLQWLAAVMAEWGW